jgi:hypothetical protein
VLPDLRPQAITHTDPAADLNMVEGSQFGYFFTAALEMVACVTVNFYQR